MYFISFTLLQSFNLRVMLSLVAKFTCIYFNFAAYSAHIIQKLDKTVLPVPLGILGGGVPPGSVNSNPISDQKMSISTSVFTPAGGHETQHYMLT